MNNSKIKILHWNIQSINSNRYNLLALIHKFSPDLVLLNETWLKPYQNFHIKNYHVMRIDKPTSTGGGVATLIHHNIKFETIPVKNKFINNFFQYCIIKINNINIINIYSHPKNSINKNILTNILNDIQGNIILIGDLNAHNPVWGSRQLTPNGRVVYELMEEFDLVVLNDGLPTRIQPPNQNPSVIDLALVSGNISGSCWWERILDVGNSDHFPTFCELRIPNNHCFKNNTGALLGRNLKYADWKNYTSIINLEIQLCNNNNKNLENMYDDFINIVNNAANKYIPNKKYFKPRNLCPWWDSECSAKIKERKLAIKSFMNNPTIENYVNAKRVIAGTRKFFRSKKKIKFQNFCAGINRNTNISYVWKNVKKFSGHKINFNNSRPNSEISLNILSNIAACNIDPEFQMIVDNNEVTFTITELKNSICSKKDTATGLDTISYTMLKNLPDTAIELLLNIFNKCIKHNFIPHSWKSQVISAFVKPNKNPDLADNFRAIILSSCVVKTLENMIKNKLNWIIEHNKILNKHQMGFRTDFGINDNLAFLISYIQLAFAENESVIGVFLDIKAAYDHVNLSRLYSRLMELPIPLKISNFIYSLNNNRTIYIKDKDNNIIGPNLVNKGIPQGSPLSCILFNLYVSSLYQVIPENLVLLSYADDLVLLGTGNKLNELTNHMNNTLHNINNWLINHDLHLSLSKCKSVWFTKSSLLLPPPSVNIDDHIISYVDEITYLGVKITNKLRWDNQINYITTRAMKGLNVLKSFCTTWWGADPVTLKLAYNGIVRSHLDFGGLIMSNLTKKNISKINTVHHQALRLIGGCMKSTPINALLSELGEMTWEYRIKWLTHKFLLKILSYNDHPLKTILQSLIQHSQIHGSYWQKRGIPRLVETYRDIRTHNDIIDKYDILPCYKFDYNMQIQQIKILDLGLKKNMINVKQHFLSEIEKFKDKYTLIFTDGSKKGEQVGFGVHIPSLNFNYSERLPPHFTIYSAELAAISKAVLISKTKNIDVIICSDSQSIISKLKNNHINSKNDSNLLDTRNLIIEAYNSNRSILLAWVPGHSQIEANERADRLANVGRELNIAMDIKTAKNDIIVSYKQRIKEEFKTYWKLNYINKGKWYTQIQEEFSFRSWFSRFSFVDRRHITTLIRMRTGHCLIGVHLHKIKIKEHPYCECGGTETLDHIFFECPIHKINNFDIYLKLSQLYELSPINIQCILANLNSNAIKMIMMFINYNKIKI